MSELDPNEAAVLTQVVSFPNLTMERRMQLLSHASNRAKAIGRIIVSGARDGDNPEYQRVAHKFVRWALENER